MKRALVTGISGQDGAYLARLLVEQGYEVFGAARRNASGTLWRLQELGIERDIRIEDMELCEFSNLLRLVERIRPDEIYNLAAQSFVGASFEQPVYTGEVDGLGVARLLEAVRLVQGQEVKFYQASTSEMFGNASEIPQTEQTPFYPRSPYGAAKLYAHWMVVNYREAYGLFGCSGILFNHESPLRGEEFVTRKITRTLAMIRHGADAVLELGNLEARRDWGFAGDYVRGMWQMLQQPEPEDYVLATGENHSVRRFVEKAAVLMDFDLRWEGEGTTERGMDNRTGKRLVQIKPEWFRPAEVDVLLGHPAKAERQLGWRREVDFEALVQMMVEADLNRVTKMSLA